MNLMLIGAIAMGWFIASFFFLRYWRVTHDRFFLFFSFAFFIEGISRTMLAFTDRLNEQEPLFYVVRLVAFLIIIFAIIDKNRSKNTGA
jgi:hypothetical protein